MRKILFMGSVLASVTHEMQNVMAIVKESGALIEDILQLNGPPKLKHGDKLRPAFTNISEQIFRGRDLMLMLNGFAHAAEDFPESADLTRFSKQIVTLASRMVRLKECSLRTDLDGPPLAVRGNALAIMQCIYLAIAAQLECCQPEDELSVSLVREHEDKPAAVFRITAGKCAAAANLDSLLPELTELKLECRAAPGVLELFFCQQEATAVQGGL